LCEYDQAGKDRRILAQKMLDAQHALARLGFSTGGRAPYGFARFLVKVDGTVVRPLPDGEVVRMAGHHVVKLPADDDRVWAVIERILDLLETRGYRPRTPGGCGRTAECRTWSAGYGTSRWWSTSPATRCSGRWSNTLAPSEVHGLARKTTQGNKKSMFIGSDFTVQGRADWI
jgi:hypothetical protein